LFLDPETDTLSDGVGGVGVREGAENPIPGPTRSGGMRPQTSLEEVRISAPEARFDAVIEAATPILESIEFHAP
jgi:hypothetical protein